MLQKIMKLINLMAGHLIGTQPLKSSFDSPFNGKDPRSSNGLGPERPYVKVKTKLFRNRSELSWEMANRQK